jgi:hypothetical protein
MRERSPPVNVRAVVDDDPTWPSLFASPADVQISVASFEPLSAFRDPIESCGFVWRPTRVLAITAAPTAVAVLVAVSVYDVTNGRVCEFGRPR